MSHSRATCNRTALTSLGAVDAASHCAAMLAARARSHRTASCATTHARASRVAPARAHRERRARARAVPEGGDDAATPDWAKDLVLDERGDLIDAKTGEPLNEFGATRFDLYVRALRGEYDAPYDTSERDDGEIMETIQQFPAKYTYQVVTTTETASEEGFVSGLVEKIAGAAGEAKVEVEVKPRGKKYSSIWCTMFVFSAKEVSDTIREIKDYDARIKMCF